MPDSFNTVANVVVQDLEGFEENAPINEQNVQGTWADYRIRNYYVRNEGRYMLGITSPNGFQGDSVAFVQLSAPTVLWISQWTASQMGSKPQIPDPTSVPSQYVLLYETPVSEMITITGGGNKMYRLSGTYVYGSRRPSTQVFDDVKFPQPPWIDPDSDRNVETSLLTGGLIDLPSSRQGKLIPELSDVVP